MTDLGQSAFLQALGWATLNSFWQMGLLWLAFTIANYLLKFSARYKYLVAVGTLWLGCLWFLVTFTFFTTVDQPSKIYFNFFTHSETFLTRLLSTASLTYLLLLAVPLYKFIGHWKEAQLLRKKSLHKANYEVRLFVTKLTNLLGIRKKVAVYISGLVKSPVTIGYLKPIILLPLAAVNQLTTAQTEAVLLHELAHIKRYDYLVNILVNLIGTFLYFNPFVHLFVRSIEEEREYCCDQIVLGFGYDQLNYAEALLCLQKSSLETPTFALGVTGRKKLLSRIETIVGMKRKPVFKLNFLISLSAVALFIFCINTLFVASNHRLKENISFTNWANPFYFLPENSFKKSVQIYPQARLPMVDKGRGNEKVNAMAQANIEKAIAFPGIVPVKYTGENPLSPDEKKQVETAIEATKKLLKSSQWMALEKEISDDLTGEEKRRLKEEYQEKLNKIDWKNLETNLGLRYTMIDWSHVNAGLETAIAKVQLDSLETHYTNLLEIIETLEHDGDFQVSGITPFPDEAATELKGKKTILIKALRELKAKRINKINL